MQAKQSELMDSQFQFTHPGRGATDGNFKPITEHIEFQFTHPGRGATARQKAPR